MEEHGLKIFKNMAPRQICRSKEEEETMWRKMCVVKQFL